MINLECSVESTRESAKTSGGERHNEKCKHLKGTCDPLTPLRRNEGGHWRSTASPPREEKTEDKIESPNKTPSF